MVVSLATKPDKYGRRDGWVVASDNEMALREMLGGSHLDDFLDHNEPQPPPGVWVWEGWLWWSVDYFGEADEGKEGSWRRATACELWRLAKGDAQPFDPDVIREQPSPWLQSFLPGVHP